MSRDLADFSNDISWFFSYNEKIEVIDEKSFICSKEIEEKFPSLTKLLKKARITKIKYENQNYQLFGWTNQSSKSFGWLCFVPRTEVEIDKTLHPDHILLLKNFGGITERWNEPEDTWLINLNNALTFEDTQIGFIGFEDYFNEMCQEEAIEVKVKPEEFISFAFEAKADYFFDFITPYENYPEYTLYKIDNCNTFRDWVEIISDQWLKN